MPKKRTPAKKQSKADYVRSLPRKTPAKEVVAKAKAAGISMTDGYVYKVRASKKTKGRQSSAAPKKKTTARKVPSASRSKARGRAPDKKNRVLELAAKNPDWTNAQIAEGAKCSMNYVYSVRGSSKKAGPMSKGKTSNGSSVADFYRAVKRIGVDQAKELLANIEAFQNA